MACARTVTFADEIKEMQPMLSGRITMMDSVNISDIQDSFNKIVGIGEQSPSACNEIAEDNLSPELLVEYNELYFNGCKINYGKKFGTKCSGYGLLQDATDVVSLSGGNVLVCDMINSKLQVFNDKGLPTVAYILDELIEPRGVTTTSEGNIVATSRKIQAITVLSSDGCLVSTFGKNIFMGPSGITVDARGNYIVTDVVRNKVFVVDTNGNLLHHIGKDVQFKQPRYVTVSKRHGDIIVSDSGNNCLKVFDSRGNFIRQIGKFGKEDGCLKVPYATTTDKFGNILVSDHYNDRISVFSSRGKFLRHIVTSAHGLSHPQGLSLSPEMVLYVSHGGLKANQVTAFELNVDGLPCDIVTTI